jgi:hypothetical protein
MQQQKGFNAEDAEAAQGTQKVIAREARQNLPRVLRVKGLSFSEAG